MKQEKIELIVLVKINYDSSKNRKEAIRKAKECALSSSILSATAGCIPKSAKLFKNKQSCQKNAFKIA